MGSPLSPIYIRIYPLVMTNIAMTIYSECSHLNGEVTIIISLYHPRLCTYNMYINTHVYRVSVQSLTSCSSVLKLNRIRGEGDFFLVDCWLHSIYKVMICPAIVSENARICEILRLMVFVMKYIHIHVYMYIYI